jgi:hypothetical protein
LRRGQRQERATDGEGGDPLQIEYRGPMIILQLEKHFDFQVGNSEDWKNPTLTVILRNDIEDWLRSQSIVWHINRTNEDKILWINFVVSIVFEDPASEMLFKLTWG